MTRRPPIDRSRRSLLAGTGALALALGLRLPRARAQDRVTLAFLSARGLLPESALAGFSAAGNADVAIEFGPGKHGMGEQDYVYFREPGGLRVELNAGGYRNYEPDWEPVRFEPQQGSNVFYKNLGMPHSMFESFPPVETAAEQADETKAATGLFN